MNASRRHDRRGPARGPLLPSEVPRWRSRSEAFDRAVLDAYAPINARWNSRLTHLDVAIDNVPRMHLRPDTIFPDEIVADGPIPLGRLIPAGVDQLGRPTRPCIVMFRRPLEKRATSRSELDSLLTHVLTRLVAVHLNMNPHDINPGFDDD